MGFTLMNPRPTRFEELTIVFDGHSKKPDINITELQSAFDDVEGTKYVLVQSKGDKIWELSILFGGSVQPAPEDMKRRMERVPSLHESDPLIHIPGDGAYRCFTVNQYTS